MFKRKSKTYYVKYVSQYNQFGRETVVVMYGHNKKEIRGILKPLKATIIKIKRIYHA